MSTWSIRSTVTVGASLPIDRRVLASDSFSWIPAISNLTCMLLAINSYSVMTFFKPSTALYFRNILLYIHHYVPQLILSAPNDMV